MLDEPRQLAPHSLDASVPADVERAAFLDPGKRRFVDAEPLGRETRSVGGAPHDFLDGEVAPKGWGEREAVAHAPVELRDRRGVGTVGVQGDQRHSAIQRAARHRRPDRVERRDRDARRHLLVRLQVKVRQDDGGCGEVGAFDTRPEDRERARVGRRVLTLEDADIRPHLGSNRGTGTSSTLGTGGSTAGRTNGSGSSSTMGTAGSSAGSSTGMTQRNAHRWHHGKHMGSTRGNRNAPGLH